MSAPVDPTISGAPAPARGTVVITRPRAQAEPLASRLRGAGFATQVLPLLEIAPLDDDAKLRAALAELAAYALVAFVSPNAIDAAFAHVPHWPAGVDIAVLGEGSRAALERHGLPAGVRVHCPPNGDPSDSEHLLAALDLAPLRGRKVLIVRGQSGRELMADGFRAAGAEVTTVAAYTRQVPPLTLELRIRLRDLLAQPNTWVITSSEALRGLAALAAAAGLPDHVAKLQQQHFFVPHARIALTARELGLPLVTLTASGDEGVFAALQSRV
jgi:uroporphyrinogen-III synthase